VAIALPITQPGEELSNDSRHYTKWGQVVAPQVASVTPINPAPEDPGTAREPQHYTEWTPK
jgi:hypothetical protein